MSFGIEKMGILEATGGKIQRVAEATYVLKQEAGAYDGINIDKCIENGIFIIKYTAEKGDIMDKEKIQIRNSTIDFLIFTKQAGEAGIEVRLHDENVCITQKAMAQLFDCSSDNISLHLKNVFKSGELDENAVTEKSSATAF